LISTEEGATPFWTNDSNPRTINLGKDESQTVTYWVNASGGEGRYRFFAYSNVSDYPSITTTSSSWNVNINIPAYAVDDYFNVTTNEQTLFDITANDIGTTIIVDSIGEAGHGTIIDNEDGTVDYTSDEGFEGVDNFTYELVNGTNTGYVYINVSATTTTTTTTTSTTEETTTTTSTSTTTTTEETTTTTTTSTTTTTEETSTTSTTTTTSSSTTSTTLPEGSWNYTANTSGNETVVANLSEISTVLELQLNDSVNGTLNITYSSDNLVGTSLSVPDLGRYIDVEASQDIIDSLSSLMLKVYYTDEDIHSHYLNESTLGIYWFNTTNSSWVKLTTGNPAWVIGAGIQNETAPKYVWANVSHFSDYAAAGDQICLLRGDFPSCDDVSLREVVDYINVWNNDEATLLEVINLINGWINS
jgi:hypothetical protein